MRFYENSFASFLIRKEGRFGLQTQGLGTKFFKTLEKLFREKVSLNLFKKLLIKIALVRFYENSFASFLIRKEGRFGLQTQGLGTKFFKTLEKLFREKVSLNLFKKLLIKIALVRFYENSFASFLIRKEGRFGLQTQGLGTKFFKTLEKLFREKVSLNLFKKLLIKIALVRFYENSFASFLIRKEGRFGLQTQGLGTKFFKTLEKLFREKVSLNLFKKLLIKIALVRFYENSFASFLIRKEGRFGLQTQGLGTKFFKTLEKLFREKVSLNLFKKLLTKIALVRFYENSFASFIIIKEGGFGRHAQGLGIKLLRP